ncbi:hypothetical protein F5887DRAFT_254602 [Amanita rubescens]|nr:hypothetical protein F5887DRAFT_254602 [Amanita rubescens]
MATYVPFGVLASTIVRSSGSRNTHICRFVCNFEHCRWTTSVSAASTLTWQRPLPASIHVQLQEARAPNIRCLSGFTDPFHHFSGDRSRCRRARIFLRNMTSISEAYRLLAYPNNIRPVSYIEAIPDSMTFGLVKSSPTAMSYPENRLHQPHLQHSIVLSQVLDALRVYKQAKGLVYYHIPLPRYIVLPT